MLIISVTSGLISLFQIRKVNEIVDFFLHPRTKNGAYYVFDSWYMFLEWMNVSVNESVNEYIKFSFFWNYAQFLYTFSSFFPSPPLDVIQVYRTGAQAFVTSYEVCDPNLRSIISVKWGPPNLSYYLGAISALSYLQSTLTSRYNFYSYPN